MARVVPSTLHQKVKFVVKEQLISVAVEEDIMATLTTFDSYIDMDGNAIKCSFQSLEVVNATFFGIGKKISTPQFSEVTKTGIKQIVGKGARAGFRFKKFL